MIHPLKRVIGEGDGLSDKAHANDALCIAHDLCTGVGDEEGIAPPLGSIGLFDLLVQTAEKAGHLNRVHFAIDLLIQSRVLRKRIVRP